MCCGPTRTMKVFLRCRREGGGGGGCSSIERAVHAPRALNGTEHRPDVLFRKRKKKVEGLVCGLCQT